MGQLDNSRAAEARAGARQRFGRTLIGNIVGLALVVIGLLTSPAISYLGFAILLGSFAVRVYIVVTSRQPKDSA